MITVFEIKSTKNPEIMQIGFEQVQDAFDKARSFNAKKAWITASKDHKFTEGLMFDRNIEFTAHTEPQYDQHEAFQGKYYTSKIV